jgi:hypothetical protein
VAKDQAPPQYRLHMALITGQASNNLLFSLSVKYKALFCPVLRHFLQINAFQEVHRFFPFVLLVRAACRRRVRSIGRIILAGVKVKINQSLHRPEQALMIPGGWDFQISWQTAHEGGKVVSPTHRPSLPLRKYSWYSRQRLSRHQGHSATGRIMSMKNSNDTTGNRTRDLPY